MLILPSKKELKIGQNNPQNRRTLSYERGPVYYLVDGYNLIFSLITSREKLQVLREKVIQGLQKQFMVRKISGTIVFDGAHRRDEESGLTYSSPLVIAYAPKGQTADDYIIEQIALAKNPKLIIVVTNDRGLGRHAQAAGATVQDNHTFIQWLQKRKKKVKSSEPKESQSNLDRLLKIFEERLRNEEGF